MRLLSNRKVDLSKPDREKSVAYPPNRPIR
jgi:hypothetical protein